MTSKMPSMTVGGRHSSVEGLLKMSCDVGCVCGTGLGSIRPNPASAAPLSARSAAKARSMVEGWRRRRRGERKLWTDLIEEVGEGDGLGE